MDSITMGACTGLQVPPDDQDPVVLPSDAQAFYPSFGYFQSYSDSEDAPSRFHEHSGGRSGNLGSAWFSILPDWDVCPNQPLAHEGAVEIFPMAHPHLYDRARIPNDPDGRRMTNFANVANSPYWVYQVPLRCRLPGHRARHLFTLVWPAPVRRHVPDWRSPAPCCAPQFRQ